MKLKEIYSIIKKSAETYNRIGKTRRETLEILLNFLGVAYIGCGFDIDHYRLLLSYIDKCLDEIVWR